MRAPKSRSESNDSCSALRSPDLNPMIRKPSFQIGTLEHISQIFQLAKWFTNSLRSSKSNDSGSAHRSPDLNSMIRDPRNKVQIWIKWFANLLRNRSKSNYSQSALLSPNLNQILRKSSFQIGISEQYHKPLNMQNDLRTRSKVLIWIKWFAIRAPKSRCE